MSRREPGVFLTAEWRHLALLNYDIEPEVLAPFVPAGTELDSWHGRTLVSVVGFLFLNTRVLGFPIPWHRHFEEVNLRFYVRRRAEEGWRRGVVFIKELVPRSAIALVARTLYHEPYLAVPMDHHVETENGVLRRAEYSWRFGGQSHAIRLATLDEPHPLREGSEAEFITEHYWGYNRQPDGSTLEYRVEHPRWRVHEACEATLECDAASLYGPRFAASLPARPTSAFLAEGSPIKVYQALRLA